MKPILFSFLLLCCTAPTLASAAIKVSEPTGNAPIYFLSELKLSLESVTAESDLPDIGDAEIRAVAIITDSGYSVTITLSPSGSPEIRQNREVTDASALSQARAMARAVIRDYAKPKTSPVPKVATELITPSLASTKTPLDEPYRPRRALGWSLTTTLLGTAVGVGILVPGFMKDNAMAWVGLGVAGTALAIGPSTGIYYANRPIRASITLGVRAALLGGWIGLFARDWSRLPGYGAGPPISWMLFPPAIISVLILAINDIVSAPHVARKTNKELKKQGTIAITPIVLQSRGGDRAPGLAITGQF